jgi:hypothetical protein
MPNDFTISWTVAVSKQTDTSLRTFLAERGMAEADFSKFIEDAVKWRVFEQTLAEVRGKFADLPPEEIETLVEEAVAYARNPNYSEDE